MLGEILAKKEHKRITIDKEVISVFDNNFPRIKTLNSSSLREVFLSYPIDRVFFTAASALPSDLRRVANQAKINRDFRKIEELLVQILKSICTLPNQVHFTYFSSCLRWGKLRGRLDEDSPANPSEKYGEHKVISESIVSNFALNCPNLIPLTLFLFNHASHLGNNRFLLLKICRAILNRDQAWLENEIRKEKIQRKNIDIGYAKQYMEFVYSLSEQRYTGNLIVATGKTLPISHFLNHAVNLLGVTLESIENQGDAFISDFCADNTKMLNALGIEPLEIVSGIELLDSLLLDLSA